jgi:hypothetical protein
LFDYGKMNAAFFGDFMVLVGEYEISSVHSSHPKTSTSGQENKYDKYSFE